MSLPILGISIGFFCNCAKNDNEVDLSRLSTIRFISYLVDNYSSLGDLFHFNLAVFLYSSFIDDMKELSYNHLKLDSFSSLQCDEGGSRSDTRLFSDCNKGNMSQPFDSTREHGSRPWGLVNTQPSQRVNERSPLSNMSNIMNGTSRVSLNKCQKRILGETVYQSQIPLSHPG
ncbi:hypothetical protein DCAR_0519724 [Daucus carota subsp. sativus]|uniref:Uncharacterized protein n=1 Tax=Daucus carota subsp. sativus TaxID=79200 RepID=A0A164Y5E4_DAUCS|nr:hypothetical protein DCAR_0519724 [Daucus carota subsp. sativus]